MPINKDYKKSKTKPASKKNVKKRKKAKVVIPRMTNVMKPQGMTLVEWQVALRRQQAEKENFIISQVDEKFCPGEYSVKNHLTRNEYKVVYRGKGSVWNYCSCLDFKTSQLGTCKHLEAVKSWLRKKREKVHRDVPSYSSVYVDYKGDRRVKIRIGKDDAGMMGNLARGFFDDQGVLCHEAYARFDVFLNAAKAIDKNFRCYDDALDLIIEQREKAYRQRLMDKRYSDSILDQLLSVKLYP